MSWLQVRVATDGEHAERVESILGDLGVTAVTLEDGGDQPLLEPRPGEAPLWEAVSVVGLFDAEVERETIAAALAPLEAEGHPLDLAFEQLPEREWSRVWLDDWQPLRFGQRLWVTPGESPLPAEAGSEAVAIRLDPGLAFGTGTHVTTALCLEWFDANPPAGEPVLDYGCGSGILAIAALLLGATRATAVDIDPQALEATHANAERNGVAERVVTVEAATLPAATWPMVVANILAGPLIELAPTFAGYQQSGGRLVLAGVLADQADGVCAAFLPWYRIEVGAEREGWVRLEGVRR